MCILVTGTAGFIGSFTAQKLLDRGNEVVGYDNHNDYYDPILKEARVRRLLKHPNYEHVRGDLENSARLKDVFASNKFDRVIHLAAQAGVRYSMENPMAYIQSNVVGFTNILECCRYNNIQHLVYASTSSVYGSNTSMPFSVHQNIDHPLSFYAATKKANELMAHTYSELYQLPTTGLRFFTVYGPWGRPDMALFKFTKAILDGDAIDVFNFGNHKRDFTYVEDIVEGVVRVMDKKAKSNPNYDSDKPDPGTSTAPWRVYNIGNNQPVDLMDYIRAIEFNLGIEAKKNMLPLQPGDVPDTYADVKDLVREFDYKPDTSIEVGVKNFVEWYRQYYDVY